MKAEEYFDKYIVHHKDVNQLVRRNLSNEFEEEKPITIVIKKDTLCGHLDVFAQSQLKEVKGKILSILYDIDDPSIKVERIRDLLESQNKEDEEDN